MYINDKIWGGVQQVETFWKVIKWIVGMLQTFGGIVFFAAFVVFLGIEATLICIVAAVLWYAIYDKKRRRKDEYERTGGWLPPKPETLAQIKREEEAAANSAATAEGRRIICALIKLGMADGRLEHHRDYSNSCTGLDSAVINIGFRSNGCENYEDLISVFDEYFFDILAKIPYDNYNMRYGFQKQFWRGPWLEKPFLPHPVENITTSLIQLCNIQDSLEKPDPTDRRENRQYNTALHNICSDICGMLERANRGEGTVYVTVIKYPGR